MFEWIDTANVDLKGFSHRFYHKLCQGRLASVLETLQYLKQETNVWLEITNLLIPGENDSPEEIEAMCIWIREHLGPDAPIHFTAFHPDFKMRDVPPTPQSTLERARDQAISTGLPFVYIDNVYDLQRESTYCPSCGKRLIERNCYELGQYNLRGNACRFCAHVIPGVFEEKPGHWGRQRRPLQIADR